MFNTIEIDVEKIFIESQIRVLDKGVYYILPIFQNIVQLFNKFYFDCKILQAEEEVRAFRLALTKATLTALTNGLGLLGIGVPEKM